MIVLPTFLNAQSFTYFPNIKRSKLACDNLYNVKQKNTVRDKE